ncbi:hypothetical protein BHE74_00023238 [Ensete ventricosum]|nr:hypothetical protein BHE74_00023238 [Ensete ventricosum]
MASHAALASSKIPSNTRFHTKANTSFSKRLEVAEFSGLRSNTCLAFATHGREASFSDVLASQLSTKASSMTAANFQVYLSGSMLLCFIGVLKIL